MTKEWIEQMRAQYQEYNSTESKMVLHLLDMLDAQNSHVAMQAGEAQKRNVEEKAIREKAHRLANRIAALEETLSKVLEALCDQTEWGGVSAPSHCLIPSEKVKELTARIVEVLK